MPDLAGSSFRTGLDMAEAGESVPVSFTVQNRGGADPGNFQVQVLLSPSNLFRQLVAGAGDLVAQPALPDATGRELHLAGRLQRDDAGRLGVGTGDLGLRIVADPTVPEAGLYDKSGVHRGSDWAP